LGRLNVFEVELFFVYSFFLGGLNTFEIEFIVDLVLIINFYLFCGCLKHGIPRLEDS